MRWNRRSKIVLLEQLEMYVSAGLQPSQALLVMGRSMPKRRAAPLEKVAALIESGQDISVSLSREVDLPPSVVGLISCGQASASLGQALKASKDLLEDQDELTRKILSSMMYPAVIGFATIALTIGLIQGVMPQIIPLLSSLHADMPALTVVVMAVSRALLDHGLAGSFVVALIIVTVIFAYRKSIRARYIAQAALLHVPIAGKLINGLALALFFRSLGTMVEAGILAEIAYEKACSTVGLLPLKRLLERNTSSLKAGEKFQVIAQRMPAYAGSLISAGEASGKLGDAFNRVASILGREIEHALKRITALVEPAMMVGMGSVVGSIALSIMIPIYDISKTLQY